MKVKEFAQQAIKNGYNSSRCEGWEWIEANLPELDYIFSTAEYKNHKGMQYLCTPLIYGNTDLTDLEKDALNTAWYLNNKREHDRAKAEYKTKMLEEGWLELTEDIVKEAFTNKKKIEINASHSVDWSMGYKINATYKPWVGKTSNTIMLMKPKARSRGYYLTHFENAFCKII